MAVDFIEPEPEQDQDLIKRIADLEKTVASFETVLEARAYELILADVRFISVTTENEKLQRTISDLRGIILEFCPEFDFSILDEEKIDNEPQDDYSIFDKNQKHRISFLLEQIIFLKTQLEEYKALQKTGSNHENGISPNSMKTLSVFDREILGTIRVISKDTKNKKELTVALIAKSMGKNFWTVAYHIRKL